MTPKAKPPIPPNQVRRYRRMRHLRLVDVAKLLGLKTAAHIAHWEKSRKLPSIRNALKLSAAVGCPVEILFGELFNEIRKQIHSRAQQERIKRQYN